MELYRYILSECEIDGSHRFGIVAICDCGTVLESYVDLSSNREKVMAFVELCNRLNLSAIHFSDAVEDFIANY